MASLEGRCAKGRRERIGMAYRHKKIAVT